MDEKSLEAEKIGKLLLDTTSGLGLTIAREINDYTVALIRWKAGKPELAGTGTLVSFLGFPYMLTAAHVWKEKLKTADKILVPLKENSNQRYAINTKQIVPLGPPNPPVWDEWGPDITMLPLPADGVGNIKALGRSFYNLSMKRERVLDHPVEARFLMGAPELRGTFTPTKAFPEVQGMHVVSKTGLFMTSSLSPHIRSEFDFIDLDIDTTQPDVASRFGGVSGGGLWRVYLYQGSGGQIESFKILEGVAFWEVPQGNRLMVRCHGPVSIGATLRYLF